MKQKLATLALAALALTASINGNVNAATRPLHQYTVYVTDETGDVNVYDSIPALPFNGNYHLEYTRGVVLDEEGNGTVTADTDELYGYISYARCTTEPGDEISTIFAIAPNGNGEYEDDIVYRIDITERDWDGVDYGN